MTTRAEEVANAVLYEGYILYPYRPSSVKNQQRWNFGVVYPPGASEGAATMQTQCLVVVTQGATPRLDIKIRFLHLMARTVEELDQPILELPATGQPATHRVARIECDGQLFQAWQEGVERVISLPTCDLEEIVRHPLTHAFAFPESRTIQPLRNPEGRIAWLIVREHQSIAGQIEVSAEPAGENLLRLTVQLHNHSPHEDRDTRDGALLRSLVSAHKILALHNAAFVSMIDPPDFCREAAAECRNTGTWPVLAGDDGMCDVMLSSPIILYDYPQIAPESAGDLCDGTEIDEILSLRILTLTDEEKREMRQSDERGRRILERTEALQEDQWLKLHGVLRGLRPGSEVTQ